MRKLLLSVVFAGIISTAFSQKIEDIQSLYSKGKYNEAKIAIDKFLADPKNQNNTTGWYYKGKIYTDLARLDSTNTLTYDAPKEAFEAFKKYQQLDPKNTLMTLDQNVGLFQVFDIYSARGIRYYNDKSYDKSFDNFKNALEIEDYISKKGYSYNNFTFPVLDTQTIKLAASSAFLAKKEDESIPYFQKLADAKITDSTFKSYYAIVAQYYSKKGDQEKADKYITLGKQLFPDDDYWIALELGQMPTSTDSVLARYQEIIQKYPNNYNLNMQYAIELFNSLYGSNKKPADYAAKQQKLQSVLTKTISINSTALANFVMSQHIYNEIYDVEESLRAVKGNAPAEAAKRRSLNAQRDKLYDEMFPYAQKAYDLYSQDTSMKIADKVNYRKVIGEISDYYDHKKQADKAAFYNSKLKDLK